MENEEETLTGTLENWFTYPAPQYDGYVVYGDIFGDSRGRFPDGMDIRTSLILCEAHPIDTLEKGVIVKTRNSSYKLGEPHVKPD